MLDSTRDAWWICGLSDVDRASHLYPLFSQTTPRLSFAIHGLEIVPLETCNAEGRALSLLKLWVLMQKGELFIIQLWKKLEKTTALPFGWKMHCMIQPPCLEQFGSGGSDTEEKKNECWAAPQVSLKPFLQQQVLSLQDKCKCLTFIEPAKLLKKTLFECSSTLGRREGEGSPNGGRMTAFHPKSRSLSFSELLAILIHTSHLALRPPVIIIHYIPSMTFSSAEFHTASVACYCFFYEC